MSVFGPPTLLEQSAGSYAWLGELGVGMLSAGRSLYCGVGQLKAAVS